MLDKPRYIYFVSRHVLFKLLVFFSLINLLITSMEYSTCHVCVHLSFVLVVLLHLVLVLLAGYTPIHGLVAISNDNLALGIIIK
jgi:hypothetical protein